MICSVVDILRARARRPERRRAGVRSTEERNSRRPIAKMPPLLRISSSLGVSGTGSYVLPCVTLAICRVAGSNVNSSPSRASATASGLCTTCRPRLKALRRKMSPMLLPAMITISRPTSSAMALSPAGDISRDDPMANRSPAITNVSPGVHARAEVGHQIAERSGLPALVQRVEALGHAVGRRRDLIGVDRVELLARRAGIPENQRLPAH